MKRQFIVDYLGNRNKEIPMEVVEEIPKKQRRSKTFSGCYTCRRRKIACDLGRPSCLKCKKSGFVCEGYDVKLRWSQPIKFDIYGYQLPSKPSHETEYCQRRSIDYVNYGSNAYNYYDEMDNDLTQLHNLYLESTNCKTVINGHFGVFRGMKIKPKRKKRKSVAKTNDGDINSKRRKSTLNGNSNVNTNIINGNHNSSRNTTSINLGNSNSNLKLINQISRQYKGLNTKDSNFMYPQNVSNSIISNTFDSNSKSQIIDGNEWLSTELLDAALLTASALNGDTHFLDMFDMENPNNIPIMNSNNNNNNNNAMNNSNIVNNTTIKASNNNNQISSLNNSNNGNINTNSMISNNNILTDKNPTLNTHNTISNQITVPTDSQTKANRPNPAGDLFNDTVSDQMLHLLFQGRNSMNYDTNQLSLNHNNNNEPSRIISDSNSLNKKPPDKSLIKTTFSHPQSTNTPVKFYNSVSQLQKIANQSAAAAAATNQQSDTSISSITLSSRDKYNHISPEEIQSIHSIDETGLPPSSIDQVTTSNPTGLTHYNTGITPTTNQNNKFKGTDQPIIDNEIKIHASDTIKMPKNIMEILETVPLPKSLAIDKFGIPITSLNVHPMARYLLNYYIEDVADMMTVIPLAKNPWKFIYFPRAIMAIGELASLGRTSNARNGLLNALLAVSAFNLQSKFAKGSNEMKYYVDLGIQLRKQANEFVERCMEEDILNQKYKDVLTAVLSMVTIDVVWGTMSSCKIHLDHCEKIIEKKMLHKKKLSSKAIILHRIFSSLKLIQDSTSFENIQNSEIFLNEKNYKNFLTGSKPTQEQLDELNKDNFRGIFRGSRVIKARVRDDLESKDNVDLRSKSNRIDSKSNYNNSNVVTSPESFYQSRQNTNTSNLSNNNTSGGISKRGKYNEKITDNGKVRIEFIVNNDDDDKDNDDDDDKDNHDDKDGGNNNKNNNKNKDEVTLNNDIPAFVDITRTNFQPSKNKLDDKVVSSDAIYGLPNSLILMFGEIVPLARFKKYHDAHNLPIPFFFDDLAEQLEFKLLTWKLEWTLIVEDENGGSTINDSIDENKKKFISPRHEGIYHHVMSFYHALIIYFYRFIEDVNPMYLLERIEKVLHHLNKIQEILENNKETSYIIPLFWQGFIAGSEAMTLFLQNGFNKWGQDIAQTGIGTYWNARQIMLEIWRRKNHNVKNSSWVDVLRDWKTNVMLT